MIHLISQNNLINGNNKVDEIFFIYYCYTCGDTRISFTKRKYTFGKKIFPHFRGKITNACDTLTVR